MVMNFTRLEIDVFYLCFLGFAICQAWILGKQKGMSDAIDYFAEKGYIELDDDWKIILDKYAIFWYNIDI